MRSDIPSPNSNGTIYNADTHDRAGRFGEVVEGEMRLNDAGRMVAANWTELPDHLPGMETDAFVVMPNHVHGMIPNPSSATTYPWTAFGNPSSTTRVTTYVLEFLGLKSRDVMSESHLEDQLLDQLQDFLLERATVFVLKPARSAS